MSLPTFEYLSPPDLKESCTALKEFEGQIAVCAGGTELVMHLKRRLKAPDYLLSLKNLGELRSVRRDGESGFTIGAMCSLKDLATDGDVRSGLAALARAAEQVASPQIRHRATLGGNICLDTRCWYYDRSKEWRETHPPCYKAGGDRCYVVKGGRKCHALFQADTVPVLLVLKAELRLVNSEGERSVALEEFFSGRGEAPNRGAPDEILTEVRVSELPPFSGTAYLKYRKRGALGFPLVGVASLVGLDGEKKSCQCARFGIVGHSSRPLLIEGTEHLRGLKEPRLSEDVIDRLLQEVKPVHQMGVPASSRRNIARVLLKRAFLESWGRARES